EETSGSRLGDRRSAMEHPADSARHATLDRRFFEHRQRPEPHAALRNLELGIWNLECVSRFHAAANLGLLRANFEPSCLHGPGSFAAVIANSKFQIPNS